MRILTWNINSVRLRLSLLLRVIDAARPDVVCLQETKTPNNLFPLTALAELGFVHTHLAGMPGYNGVAILSRQPFRACQVQDWCDRSDCRHAWVMLDSGVEVHCVYIPSGGDIPDPAANPKFEHKLAFLEALTGFWSMSRRADTPMVVTGDFNVAPLEHDVWSHKALLDVVSHTPVEVAALGRMQGSVGWVDAVRHFVPADEKLYTWWSYRARDWEISDRGRRLDHIWVTPPLAPYLVRHEILREVRGWLPKPSDHVPVLVELQAPP